MKIVEQEKIVFMRGCRSVGEMVTSTKVVDIDALPPEEAAIARLGKQRWFLDRDCAGNEYLIPGDRRDEWDAWDIACEEAGEVLPPPTWAKPLKGLARWVEFECPEEVSA